MIGLNDIKKAPKGEPVKMLDVVDFHGNYLTEDPLLLAGEPFTRSNGTLMARLYERLTKASRRGPRFPFYDDKAYRKGVYDAYKALQEELV